MYSYATLRCALPPLRVGPNERCTVAVRADCSSAATAAVGAAVSSTTIQSTFGSPCRARAQFSSLSSCSGWTYEMVTRSSRRSGLSTGGWGGIRRHSFASVRLRATPQAPQFPWRGAATPVVAAGQLKSRVQLCLRPQTRPASSSGSSTAPRPCPRLTVIDAARQCGRHRGERLPLHTDFLLRMARLEPTVLAGRAKTPPLFRSHVKLSFVRDTQVSLYRTLTCSGRRRCPSCCARSN